MKLVGLTAGEIALTAVRRQPFLAKVLSVSRRTVHLHTDDGEIVALCTRDVENGPLNIRLDTSDEFTFSSLGLSEGEAVRSSLERISVNSRLVVNLKPVAMWRPRTLRKALTKNQVAQNRRTIMELVLREGRREGLLGLLSLLRSEYDMAEEKNPYVKKGMKAASQLLEGTRSRNDDQLEGGIAGLVGLGPGLTPAGDDVMTGFVLALREAERLGIVAARYFSNLRRLIPAVCKGRTNLLSERMLLLACEGLVGESASEAVNSLYGRDSRWARRDARRLIGMGHSSGTDILVGVLLATSLFYSARSS